MDYFLEIQRPIRWIGFEATRRSVNCQGWYENGTGFKLPLGARVPYFGRILMTATKRQAADYTTVDDAMLCGIGTATFQP